MKTNTFKFIIIVGIVAVLVACSTKKNTFLSRNSHALSTKDNILYNGGIALDKGVADLKHQYNDNFWDILPIERMQIIEPKDLEQAEKEVTKNPDFEKAETKATKAVQKHSMNIDGSEKNPQIDEAYLMLGKARYYDQRFLPALEAFNYILDKYPTSDKIFEAKIWREKTNMRMSNDGVAVKNLRNLLSEIKKKDQIYADANATLSQAFLNLEEKDSAIARLRLATQFTKSDEEKARYRFIMGQVFEQKGQKDSAFARFQEVIDMKRKSPRQYAIHAYGHQASQFDNSKGDTLAFMTKYRALLKDRENRPYLGPLNHQVALFYDKQKIDKKAIYYYNQSLNHSLASKPQDHYLIASNYRNLAEIYFNEAKYVAAGKYYDSTMVDLEPRTREYNLIKKKRANLDDVIHYEGIAQRNDSILKIASLSQTEKENYYNQYIGKLKAEEKKQKELADIQAGLARNKQSNEANNSPFDQAQQKAITPVALGTDSGSTFYFYNPSTVEYGKLEFKKKWGDRAHIPYWRLAKQAAKDDSKNVPNNNTNDSLADTEKAKEIDPKFTTAFYLKQIPSSATALDSIGKERNYAYYQLGVIYKEKFKEYRKAADKLESLLQKNPEERLILPSMYNLYKIYEIIDPAKAQEMKDKILNQYPNSRYAQILNKSVSESQANASPEATYDSLYKEYLNRNYREVLPKTEAAIEHFTGEEILSKFELLKANIIGKLKGLNEYSKALNFVVMTYPNSEEGKNAQDFIDTKIPYLESFTFNSDTPTSWKILYNADNLNDKNTKILLEKLTKFAKERTIEKLTVSTDIYTMDKNFIVIHGIKSLDNAKGIAQVLKEFKDYKITEPSTVISSENYKVVQIKKNIDEYITGDWLNKPIVPVQKNIVLPETKSENIVKEQQPKEAQQPKDTQQQQEGKKDLPGFKDRKSQFQQPPANPGENGLFTPDNTLPPTPNKKP